MQEIELKKTAQEIGAEKWKFYVALSNMSPRPRGDENRFVNITIFMPTSFLYCERRCNGIEFCESFAASTGKRLPSVVITEAEQIVREVAPELFSSTDDYDPLRIHEIYFFEVKEKYQKNSVYLTVPESRSKDIIDALYKRLNEKMMRDWIRYRIPSLRTIALLALHKTPKTPLQSVLRYLGMPSQDIAQVFSMFEEYRLWEKPLRENMDRPETWGWPAEQ